MIKPDDHPTLAVIQIGNDTASNSYIKGKKNDCEEVGIDMFHLHYDENISEEELLSYIEELNYNTRINGIIVQLPIPDHLDVKKIQEAISPAKDVDGFNKASRFKPCTPLGIMMWLKANNIELRGKDVCVIGRSEIVGKPMVNMLIDEGATVTCCNSLTRNIWHYTRYADIVICAVGKPKKFNGYYFSNESVIIDVGINRDENGKLCGDIDKAHVEELHNNVYISPVPAGVGLLTRLALLQNTYEAWRNQNELLY